MGDTEGVSNGAGSEAAAAPPAPAVETTQESTSEVHRKQEKREDKKEDIKPQETKRSKSPPRLVQKSQIRPAPISTTPQGNKSRSPSKFSAMSSPTPNNFRTPSPKRPASVAGSRPPGTPQPVREHEVHPIKVHSESPGPAYSPMYEFTRPRSPTSKFGTAPRGGGGRKHDSSPGPIYNIDRDQPWKKRATSAAFSRAERFEKSSDRSVSPGPAYTPDYEKTKKSYPRTAFPRADRYRTLSPEPGKDSPGPGTYEYKDPVLNKEKKYPAYSFGSGKRRDNTSPSVSPGPVYSVDAKDKVAFRSSPGFSFGKAKKMPDEMKKTEMGPQYLPDYTPTRPKDPSYSFPKGQREVKSTSGGTSSHPGYIYNPTVEPESKRKKLPAYSFGKARKSGSPGRRDTSPGPIYMVSDEHLRKSSPSFSFPRDSKLKPEPSKGTPGPVYDPKIEPTRPSSRATSFPKANRDEQKRDTSPGPAYSPDPNYGKKTYPRATFGTGERRPEKRTETPGPDYNPDYTVTKSRSPSTAFTKDKRYRENNRAGTMPSPGQYDLVDMEKVRKKSPSAVLYFTG